MPKSVKRPLLRQSRLNENQVKADKRHTDKHVLTAQLCMAEVVMLKHTKQTFLYRVCISLHTGPISVFTSVMCNTVHIQMYIARYNQVFDV